MLSLVHPIENSRGVSTQEEIPVHRIPIHMVIDVRKTLTPNEVAFNLTIPGEIKLQLERELMRLFLGVLEKIEPFR